MDYGKLKSNLYDFILTISLNFPDEVQQQMKVVLTDIERAIDPSTLPILIGTLTNMMKSYNENHHTIRFNLFNEEMSHLKEKHDIMQASLSDVKEKGGPDLEGVKVKLQELFDSLSNVIQHQNNKIVELESKVTYLLTKSKSEEEKVTHLLTKSKIEEKRKLIADILNPLTGELHNYLNSLPGKSSRYDDSCIYKAFQEKLSNNEFNEAQYKLLFGKPIDETTYQQFYSFLSYKANELNISFHSLVSLLYEKKTRNFTQHSDITDFLFDSLTTFKYKFVDLLDKHQLADVFVPEELNGLKAIFETYSAAFITEARRREQEAANSI